MPCPIWGTPAEERPRTGDFTVLDSPRAGGWYSYTGSVANQLLELSAEHKMAVTRWLCGRRAMGTEIPRLDSGTLPAAKTTRRSKFSEKLNSALLNLSAGLLRLDKGFEVPFADRSNGDVLKLIALTDSHDFNELVYLLRTARDIGLLSDAGGHAQLLVFTPTPAGWERIEHLQTREQQSSQAFVAMWFGDRCSHQSLRKSLKVSTYPLENSRFLETRSGDRGRKPLRGDVALKIPSIRANFTG
jgi:hypothetical protein